MNIFGIFGHFGGQNVSRWQDNASQCPMFQNGKHRVCLDIARSKRRVSQKHSFGTTRGETENVKNTRRTRVKTPQMFFRFSDC